MLFFKLGRCPAHMGSADREELGSCSKLTGVAELSMWENIVGCQKDQLLSCQLKISFYDEMMRAKHAHQLQRKLNKVFLPCGLKIFIGMNQFKQINFNHSFQLQQAYV